MRRTVWILNHYAGNMFLSKGGRHYCLSKHLRENGYNPYIFCSNFDHFTHKNCIDDDNLWMEKEEPSTGVPYIFIKTREYSNNGIARVLNMLDFYRRVLKLAPKIAKIKGAPDVIYASSVHPLTLVAGIKLAKRFGVKCISEVRDLWPESLVAYSSKWSSGNPVIKVLYAGEKWIYKKSDAVIFTMEGAYDYIVERGWEKQIPRSKVHYINNGIDLELFDKNKNENVVNDPDLDNTSNINIVYVGSIRKVNNIGKLLNVAKHIKNDRIRFLVWGDGNELSSLMERKDREKINNVIFKGHVPKEQIPYITSRADINFAHNDSSPLFRYGISFNKIFDYLAAGRPIICDFYSEHNPVLEFNGGINADSIDEKKIAETIDAFACCSPERLADIGNNARKGAEQYDYCKLTRKLIKVIEEV